MAQQKTALLKKVIISSCNRILSKGREALSTRPDRAKDIVGSAAFETWKETSRAENFDARPSLPASFSFHIEYDDAADPQKPPDRVILTSHGSPGSHEDFKYITPKLVSAGLGFRVLGFNWPEHGYSEVADDQTEYFYCHSSDERAELLASFLDRLQIKKVDVMIGHSFGCYPLMAFGADDAYRNYCNGLILVNCGGPSPHKSIRPYGFITGLATLNRHPVFGVMARGVFYAASRLFGLKVKSVDLAASNMMVISHLGYQQLPHRIGTLRTDSRTPRVLYVYAEDDPLIESASCENLARALGAPTPVRGTEDGALKKVEQWWKSWNVDAAGGGSKNLAVNFGKGRGGHFLQKHEAEFLAHCVRIMSDK